MPPVLEGFDGQAQKKGWLVYRINQMFLPTVGNASLGRSIEGGICGGLAARWISLQYAGQDLPFEKSRLEFRAMDHPAVRAQAAMKQYSDRARAAGAYNLYTAWEGLARHFHMTASPGLRNYFVGAPSAESWMRVIGRAYGCYGVIMTNGTTASHAIAIRHSQDNRFHLFDPNYGHYVAKYKEGFAEFFKWYLGMNDYGRDYSAYQAIIGIRPPS